MTACFPGYKYDATHIQGSNHDLRREDEFFSDLFIDLLSHLIVHLLGDYVAKNTHNL